MALSPKQQRFVDEYLVDLNATDAARRAGYSDPNYGRQLITKPNVAAAIRTRRDALSRKLEITQERVLQELARIGFADIRRLFSWDEERAVYVPSGELDDDEAAAVAEVQAETIRTETDDGLTETRIKLKLKTYDKLGALDKLGKHLGLFVERHEHTGPGGGPVEVTVTRRVVDPGEGRD